MFENISITSNRLDKQNLRNEILKPNGLLSTSKDEYMLVYIWTDYFRTLFNPPDTGLSLGQLGSAHTCGKDLGQESLNSPITMDEVEREVNTLEEHKAPDSDQQKICLSVMKCEKIL